VQGTVHRRGKRKRAARKALQRALGIFEERGAALWAGKAMAELRRIGLRPPESSRETVLAQIQESS
jgi:hypothetical protein